MKVRQAQENDLEQIIGLLANDKLGQLRETFSNPLPVEYYKAFKTIECDPNQHLVVLENELKEVIGTLQLSIIQYLTYQGGKRAQIEAVRIRQDNRGKGLGKALFEWAINQARQEGAHLVQLTTDKKRPKALAFYEQLGFIASHEGMKLHL
jgi:GNAT superfamily N-acetyltransferase